MYGMFKEAGLADVTVNGGAVIFTDYESSFQHLELEKASKAAVAQGVISEQEQERWVADLQRKGEQGRFLASITTFRVAGTRM